MKTITIAIPTYNRCGELKKTLDAMIAEDIHRLPGLEIMVRDNNSPDATFDLLREYKAKYGIQITRNGKNYGMNENIGAVLKSCTTDYFLLTSDEDPIKRKGLLQLMALLQQNDFAFGSTLFFNENKLYRGRADDIQRIPANEFHHCSFYISGLVYNTRLAQECWMKMEEFVYDRRCLYPHTFMTCMLLAKYGCFYLPIELAHAANVSDFNGLGEYWTVQRRMEQEQVRGEFLAQMVAGAENDIERATYLEIARTPIFVAA